LATGVNIRTESKRRQCEFFFFKGVTEWRQSNDALDDGEVELSSTLMFLISLCRFSKMFRHKKQPAFAVTPKLQD